MHVIINGLHPYYSGLESTDTIEECIRQYVYDAIAEYQVMNQTGKINPDSVRRLKDQLLRAKILRVDNAVAQSSETLAKPRSAAE
jgi:hypothetical protein